MACVTMSIGRQLVPNSIDAMEEPLRRRLGKFAGLEGTFIGSREVGWFVPGWLGGKEKEVRHAQEAVCGAAETAKMINGEGDEGVVLGSDGGNNIRLRGCGGGTDLVFVANGFEV